MPLTKKQRQQVWDKSKGFCWYCGITLPDKGWHVDHVEPVFRHTRGNQTIIIKPQHDNMANMVPSCARCNNFKSVLPLEDFRRELGLQVTRARKKSVNFRNAERYGLIEIIDKPVIFWFEKESGE